MIIFLYIQTKFTLFLSHTRLYSRFFFGCICLVGLLNGGDLSSSLAQPSSSMPDRQWTYSSQLALRYNPLGFQEEFYAGYKKKLYSQPKNDLLFGKSYWSTGVLTRMSPQFLMGGLFVKALPIAVLELQGSFAGVYGFAKAENLPSYYTQGTQDAVESTVSSRVPTGSLIQSGWQASLQARLQAKVGPIAFRVTNLFRRFELDAGGVSTDEDVFYDQTLDMVTPLQSWVYNNDTDLLYADDQKSWVIGARYTLTRSLTDIQSPELKGRPYDIQRAGLLFAWKFAAPFTAKGLEARKRHALIILSQWHIEHAYRTGQSMNQAIPYFAVVYALSGRFDKE